MLMSQVPLVSLYRRGRIHGCCQPAGSEQQRQRQARSEGVIFSSGKIGLEPYQGVQLRLLQAIRFVYQREESVRQTESIATYRQSAPRSALCLDLRAKGRETPRSQGV